MNIRKKKVEIPAGDRTMWEQSIFTKVWEFGKDGAAMVKKHCKNGLMLCVFLLAMFFLGRSIGAIAFGLHLQREMSIRESAGTGNLHSNGTDLSHKDYPGIYLLAEEAL